MDNVLHRLVCFAKSSAPALHAFGAAPSPSFG
jgi:hypothetical protein